MRTEFELITRFFDRASERNDVITGIGDDAAVVRVPPGMDLVTTTDTLIENVHFFADAFAEDIGYKALAVNLSDLAAMGAMPAWATLAITLPNVDEVWLQDFCTGLFALAQEFDVALIGGDTTRGQRSITLQAMGCVPVDQAIHRGGARSGDYVYVTGTVGDAGLALMDHIGEISLDKNEKIFFYSRLNRPAPRVAAGLALRTIASAACDISDGLIADLTHLLEASNVGAKIDLENIPLSTLAERAIMTNSVAWYVPLTSGDDYELLFTVPSSQVVKVQEIAIELDCAMTQIGIVTENKGLQLERLGQAVALPGSSGYDHFSQ